MADTTKPTKDKDTRPDVLYACTVVLNGVLIDGCHHAAGKIINLPIDKARALAALNPPGVKIDGVA
jgi:hypothetical protein